MHTDRQIQDYLLCHECERMLNEGGENWVNPKLATMARTFPIYDLVMNSYRAGGDEKGGIYYAFINPRLDVQKLTHFALGIFWKAAIHSWSGTKTGPMIDLGEYTEPIRKWLRGEAELPQDVTLTITVAKPETAFIVLQQPVEITGVAWRRYRFYVPGVMFGLNVGAAIEEQMREICFYGVVEHPIFISDDVMEKFNARLGKDYVESRKTESYVKKMQKRQQSRAADGSESH